MISLIAVFSFVVAQTIIPSFDMGYEPYLSNNLVRTDLVIPASARGPIKNDIASLGPQISAQSALVVDAKSGKVLFSKNSDEPHTLASVVKLMTALVFLEDEPDLDEKVYMKEEHDREGGEDFIRPDEGAKLRDFLVASLLGSANNATITLSRSTELSGEDFVKRMNKKAKEIGMKNTVFVDPSGLSPKNTSTARDIVKLLKEADKNNIITDIAGIYRDSILVYPSRDRRFINTTNHLMGTIARVKFGKTGYLDESLYNLAVAVSDWGGNLLYIVTLGSETNSDRVQDAKNLAVWAQNVYEW